MTAQAIELLRVGREESPVVVIDGFVRDPDRLRRAAVVATFVPARNLYPGVRAELPEGYWDEVGPAVEQAIAEIIGRPSGYALIDASFSIVSTPPAALEIGQRMPHCDAHGRDHVAPVHFLTGPEQGGGTGFYRHRSTGFEAIDARRRDIFRGQLDAELRYGGPPAQAFVGDEDRLFERTALVEARDNRAILYPGVLLHSGAIPASASLSADPAKGRLTVTGFLATTG